MALPVGRGPHGRNRGAGILVVLPLLLATACRPSVQEQRQPLPEADAGEKVEEEPAGVLQVSYACALPYRAEVGRVRTWRIPFPNQRAGERGQVAFWGHWGELVIESAWFGRWSGDGRLVDAVQLSFEGSSGSRVPVGEVGLSDPFDFHFAAGERYVVSLAGSGLVPEGLDFECDGVSADGNLAAEPVLEGVLDWRAHAVKWVAVRGEAQRVVAVLGDSIGAGQSASRADERYLEVAQRALRYPVIDASVGGDGVERALNRLERDVLALPGVTDCLVALGTNDLHRSDAAFLVGGLTELYGRLRDAGIRPWAATLPPKPGHLNEAGERTRQEVNRWLREQAPVEGVADFDAVLRAPGDQSAARPGMLADGIHPTTPGHEAMAGELVRALGE